MIVTKQESPKKSAQENSPKEGGSISSLQDRRMQRNSKSHANAEQIGTAKCPIKDDGNAKGTYDERPGSTDQSSSDEDPIMKGGVDHTAQQYMAEVPVKEGGRDNTAQSGSDEDPMKIDGDDHTAQHVMAEVPVKEGGHDNTDQSGSDEDSMKIDSDDHTAQGYMAEVPIKEGG
ncbi:MAG: hypothetical protein MJE68_03525, partial [Proteobacteria bacterium]|nr:hypothetical protein [Pseudomonadota bacterium]